MGGGLLVGECLLCDFFFSTCYYWGEKPFWEGRNPAFLGRRRRRKRNRTLTTRFSQKQLERRGDPGVGEGHACAASDVEGA
jgi:hypothetical protein